MTPFGALVTDTHPLLFKAAGGRRLSARAMEHFHACDHREALLYVPAMVIWESFILHRMGRVELQPSPRSFFENLFRNPAYQALDLTPEQVYLAGDFQLNYDPFDILICAAARSLELPLLTRDSEITGSGVEVVW